MAVDTDRERAQTPKLDREDGRKYVRGIASDVILDEHEGVAIKMYRHNRFIETLYRAAFQSGFPYVDNRAALKASQYRRKIAGLITLYLLGEDVVTPVVAVEKVDGRFRFVTELVRGGSPKDHHKARAFLHRVTGAFIRSGLPTWQVTPHNPRSLGNVMETEDGHYRIIDLESNVVTPMVPLTRVWTSAREAHLPPFDDIDVLKLSQFLNDNWPDIRDKLGDENARQLARATSKYIWYERLWHGQEPRLWSRGLRSLTRILDVPGHLRAVGRWISGWSSNSAAAAGWLESGVDRWEEEGRLNEEQAVYANRDLESTETLTVLAHLGGHMAMSIPLRFPLGSIARFLWTLTFRARAEVRALVHRNADEETRRARAVHSVPVMIAAAIPGFGAAAYVLAAPLRKNRILMAVSADQALRLLPFRLYSRLHLATFTNSWVAERNHGTRMSLLSDTRNLVSSAARQPSRVLASLIPMIVAAIVLIATWTYLGWTGNHDVVGEYGTVASAKLAMSATAAAAGLVYFRTFWRHHDDRSTGAAGTLFWLAAGFGALWVAADDYFEIHDALASVTPTPFLVDRIVDNADALVQAGYAIIAIVVVRLFWTEVTIRPAAAILLLAGLLFAGGALAVDGLLLSGSDWSATEESLHLLGAAAITSGIAFNYLEVRRDEVR